MQHIVSLEKCSSYSQNDVDKSARKLIDNLGGIENFVKKGQKVLLKPNVVKGMAPEECGTTHPAVVESMIKILKEINRDVYVGDNPFADDAIEALKICGIYDV